MINLLPPETKQNIAFAKRNTLALKFVILIIVVASILTLLMLGGNFYANHRVGQLENQLGDRQANIASLEPIRAEAKQLGNTIDTIDSLIEQQSYYSHFIAELGQTMPDWAAITRLDLQRDVATSKPDPNQGKRVDLEIVLNDIERVSSLRQLLASMQRVEYVDIQQAREGDNGAVTAQIVLGLNTAAHNPLSTEEPQP